MLVTRLVTHCCGTAVHSSVSFSVGHRISSLKIDREDSASFSTHKFLLRNVAPFKGK